ncbi:MAG TPA: amidohydrolase family protein [Streptosporangiaceae bacterium]
MSAIAVGGDEGRTTIAGVHLLDERSRSGLSQLVDVEVAGGRVVRIRSSGGHQAGAGTTIDGRAMLALPGLVNAHFHSSGTFNRGLIDNLPLELFMLQEVPPFDFGPFPPEIYRAQVLLSATRMLKTGVTAVMDDVIFYPAASSESLEAVMSAYHDSGMRATVAIYQPNKAEYSWFPHLRENLPPEYVSRIDQEPPPRTDEIMEMYGEFVRRWNGTGQGRVRCAVSCSAPQRATDDYLVRLHELARRHGLPYNVHLYESKLQRVAADLLYEGSLVGHLKRLGILDELTVLIHAVWVDEKDMADIGEAGSVVVHSPSGNLRCGSGLMPFRGLREAGTPIALCTDEATVADDCSMWSVGRLTGMIHTLGHPDYRTWPRAGEILEAMTSAGARALQLSGEIGVLAEGARADLILVDLNSDVYLPLTRVVNQLVYGEDGRSVRMVMVDGRVVVRDGRVTTVDEDALAAEARALAAGWLGAAGPAATWAERLRPAFEAMYRRSALSDVGLNRWAGNDGIWLGGSGRATGTSGWGRGGPGGGAHE